MPKFPNLFVVKKSKNRYCGEFSYAAKMPWGPWSLTRKPKTLFKTNGINVLECFADEAVQDDSGFAPHRSPGFNPGAHHFLVGKSTDGSIVWWHNLGHERFDTVKNRPSKAVIYRDGDKVVVQGFGFELEPMDKLTIDIKTGIKTKLPQT